MTVAGIGASPGARRSPRLRAALSYAGFTWPVFPLRGKVPWVSKEGGGNGVHDATVDPDRITDWWRRFPRANIGLAAGARSGFWVLDVDPGRGGADTLDRLEAEHGPLPHTPEQVTGGGGRHILFRWNGEAIKNRAGEGGGVGAGLDTRATGGYIVAAPSIHPDTGRPYRWHPERHPRRVALAAAPGWLLERVVAEPEPRRPKPAPRRPPARSWGPAPAYARAALDRAARAIAAAAPGTQEATLNAQAYSIGRLIGAGLMPADFARAVLVRAGSLMIDGDPRRPWRPAGIERKVDRALDEGRRNPRAPGGRRP